MKYAIITDHIVARLYGYKLQQWLQKHSLCCYLFSFPSGEKYKTEKTKKHLEEALFKHSFSKDTTLIALGGGVVLDLVGFIAATFCRGVGLIFIPTTLLAMVDAALGGKNGINTKWGKNSLGCYFIPSQIWIHEQFLKTLSLEELYNGKVEFLKLALVYAPSLLFQSISQETIFAALEIKRRIIAQDFEDRGIRRILNLGHTVGHALELLSNYTLTHGKAVATGILIECALSYRLGILTQEDWDLVQKLFPFEKIEFTTSQLIQAMKKDKKNRG